MRKNEDYPALPPGKYWPAHMVGDTAIKVSLRETFAKISWQVRANRREEAEKKAALAWCRANGNPHEELMNDEDYFPMATMGERDGAGVQEN